MSFLISRILGNVVKIFPAYDKRSVHFRRDNGSGEDTAANGDFSREGTFLVF